MIIRSVLPIMRNVSDKSDGENVNTHFMFNKLFLKLCHLSENVEKYGTARHATYDNIVKSRKAAICMPDK
jgi:hypothetical protein